MNGLGLSAEQIAERRKRIHAGDAAKIMAGEWRSLWRIKMGLDPEDDLSGELRVQLGSFTEPFNLAWCEQVTGRRIKYYSANPVAQDAWNALTDRALMFHDELQVSETYSFMAANLDGMTTTPQGHPCVIDAKHVGKFGEAEILRYTPAMTHQATVMGVDWWALSVLIGNGKHEVYYAEVDPLYQADLIAKEQMFWSYVKDGTEPPDMTEPRLPPKPQPKRREIILDITPESEQPNWAGDFRRLARTFAETKGAHDLHMITRKEMDALLPEDVGLAQVGLVKAKRDGRGFSVSMEKNNG